MPVDWLNAGERAAAVLPVRPRSPRDEGGDTMSVTQLDDSVWQEYRTRLFHFVRKRVDDDASAEDIVHDVLVRAYEKRGTLRNATKFEQWLFQITRNAVIDHYRARKPTADLPADLAADELTGNSARRELAACMSPMLDSLPEHYRAALVLSELQGLTQQDTATKLGLSLSGAKSRVQRARRMLEVKMLECCRLEFDSRGDLVDFESNDSPTPGGPGCGICS